MSRKELDAVQVQANGDAAQGAQSRAMLRGSIAGPSVDGFGDALLQRKGADSLVSPVLQQLDGDESDTVIEPC
jgi:hypothetical protein